MLTWASWGRIYKRRCLRECLKDFIKFPPFLEAPLIIHLRHFIKFYASSTFSFFLILLLVFSVDLQPQIVSFSHSFQIFIWRLIQMHIHDTYRVSHKNDMFSLLINGHFSWTPDIWYTDKSYTFSGFRNWRYDWKKYDTGGESTSEKSFLQEVECNKIESNHIIDLILD